VKHTQTPTLRRARRCDRARIAPVPERVEPFRRLIFFVREAFPSRSTGVGIQEGPVTADQSLTIHTERTMEASCSPMG
jgi:hypothetical protein